MKYDIYGLEKEKIIDHYKVIKNKNNRYNINIYYRKGLGKALNYPYDDMVDLKKELDKKMLEQLKLLVENDEIAGETISTKVVKDTAKFSIIGFTISFVIPITLSIILANPINLILMPIFMKITQIYQNKYLMGATDDEYNVYEKYKMCAQLEDEFDAIKLEKINLNRIDNYKIKELEKLKNEIIRQKELQDSLSLQNEIKPKEKVKKL